MRPCSHRPLVSSSRDASYAVAASLRLARARGADDGEGSPRSPGSGGGQGEGRDSKSGDEFVARLEGVTILPSADWFALALVCGGLRTARSVGVDVPHTVHFQLLDEAERVGAEMRNLIESGGALTRAADDGKQLGQRIEALFQRLPNKRPAPVDAADDEEDDAAPLGDATPPPADWEAPAEVPAPPVPAPPVPAPPVALPDDELALAVAEFKRPLRGDVVSTRWGEARVERAGADRLVLRLTNWRATAYLQPSEILHIVQRRGGIASVDPVAEHNGRASPPTGRASPATGKTSPLGGRASPLTGRIESLNGRVSPRGRNSTTCSPPVKLDVVAATQPPRAPAFADLAPPLGAVLKPTVQQQDDAAGREDRKRWILDRKAAVEVPHFALMAPMQQPSTAMPSLAVAESKRDAATRRVRELFHLEPKAWVVAPGKVVSSARRWLGDGDAELLCVFVLDAVVAANGVEVLWDRRATELLGCIAELGPANLISGAPPFGSGGFDLWTRVCPDRFPVSFPRTVFPYRLPVSFARIVSPIGLARTSESQPKLLSRFAFLLKNLYDADMLDEDTILRWHGSPGNAGAKFAALPLVTWLKEAEEEEDDA
ncbi:hypothetical protein M885DRAFT_82307 [Pelagophyceae sp. CCMP2097]|nr:hypothetical protein M885DRAFT_82307 [Pelagophyceae sp. CCMP2097]